MVGLTFDFVWEANKKIEEWESREDGSCSWHTTRAFFSYLEADIHKVDPTGECQLQIYRGYDQGPEEKNDELQREVIRAIRTERIDKFRKVNVVTTPKSVPYAVNWIQPFAEDQMLREKSRFYVSFRKNQNVGSYVILGGDNCYIAFAGSEIDHRIEMPSKTECGMFTRNAAIRGVIYDFIKALRTDYRAGRSIHGMKLHLDQYLEEGKLNRGRLEQEIIRRFNSFIEIDEREEE
jgi:hypothetical protein